MSGALRTLGIVTAGAVSISVLTYLLALAIGLAVVSATQLGPDLLGLTGFLPIEAFTLFIPTFLPTNLLILVDVCLIIYSACFWAAARGKGGFVASLRTVSNGAKPRGIPNWLVAMPLVSSTLLIIVLILTYSLNAAGIPSGTLNEKDASLLFANLTYSPIAEEVGFRITTLGLLVGIRAIWHYSRSNSVSASKVARTILSALLSPERAKENTGLQSIGNSSWRGIHWTEWILLLFTSSVFGIDHVTSGAGWGPGKALTAGLSGFILGIVYLGYGAYADILLHWFFNFYFEAFIIGAAFSGIITALGDLAALLTFAVGALGFLVGIVWLVVKKPSPVEAPMAYKPP